MVATFLQQELADELKKIFEGFRLKNPQGEESELNIFEQLLPCQNRRRRRKPLRSF